MNKFIKGIIETIRYNLGDIPETEYYIEDHIEAGNMDVVRRLIENDRSLIQRRDPFGNSLLHIAVQERQAAIVKFLIEAGCDVNARDEDGQTPLHVEATFPSKEIAEMLIQKGADPRIEDNHGDTASSIARKKESSNR